MPPIIQKIKGVLKKIFHFLGYEVTKIETPAAHLKEETRGLTELEKDFIEFVSMKTKRPPKKIEETFIDTRNRFKFQGDDFQKFYFDIYDLFKVYYDNESLGEKELVKAYKFYQLLHLFIRIGESYNADFKPLARFLLGTVDKHPVVVDYGCGLGYISFEICKLDKYAKIYLVDIDRLPLEFALFRFRKYGFDVESIIVSDNNIYPELPPHNICIATEVMEHLKNPMVAFGNIYEKLEKGGILYGGFSDHDNRMSHVTTDLGQLRDELAKHFNMIKEMTYIKKD